MTWKERNMEGEKNGKKIFNWTILSHLEKSLNEVIINPEQKLRQITTIFDSL
jgi:hypothetical protein